jgi:L-fucose isomerase-like protein
MKGATSERCAQETVMLTESQLTEALQAAAKEADVCGRLCCSGATIEEKVYVCWHNGLGDSDSDKQRVHSATALALAQPAWQQRSEAWLKRLHAHKRFCLNEGKDL